MKIKKIILFFLVISFVFLSVVTHSVAAESIQSWSSATNLPYELASHTAVYYNGKILIIGGANNDIIPTNLSTIINTDGSLSSWVSSIPLVSRYWHALATKENRVYVLGGADSSFTDVSAVYLGIINGNGDLDNWNTMTPLPVASHLGGAVVVNDKLYYAHGTTILKSPINPEDGTIGSWSQASTLPADLSGFGLVEHNNHLILVGGRIGVGSESDKVYTSSEINPDGTITSWTETSPLPHVVNRGMVKKIGTMLFTIGGAGPSILDKVYYTKINNDGTVEAWETSSHSLPEPLCCAGIAVSNNHIYITGGYGNGYRDTVYYTKIASSEAALTVPLLKQTAEPWQSQEYDTAHLWSPANPTINRWGCALTSATMVFKYHGINKLPDGTNLDPGTLNTWLNSQNDGYIRKGWVNWLALSRLSKFSIGINNITEFDALEYKRKNGDDKQLLTSDLNNSIPDILEEPGHFVVARGIDGDTFKINDPFYNRETLNDYGNTFLSLGRFMPSNTDLSYIMVVADADVTLKLLDSGDNVIAESFVQQPIIDPADPQSENEPISILYAPQPETGDYKIISESSGSDISEISFYLYNTEGNVAVYDEQVLNNTYFDINYDKNNPENEQPKKNVSFQSIIDDIKTIDDNNQINHGLATGMVALINQSQKEFDKGNKEKALKFLDLAEKLLNISHKLLTNDQVYQLLLDDLSALKNLINS